LTGWLVNYHKLIPKGVLRVNAKQIWQATLDRIQPRVSPAVFTTWFQGASAVSLQEGVLTVRVSTPFAQTQLEGRFSESIRSILFDITGTTIDIHFEVVQKQAEPATSLQSETVFDTPKRSHRSVKERPLTSPRGKRNTEETETVATAANSLASMAPQANAYRSTKNKPPQQDIFASMEELPIPPESPKPPLFARGPVQEPTFSPSNGMGMEGLLNPRYTFNSFIVGRSNQLAHAASLAVSENPGRMYNPLFLYGGVGLGKTHLMHAIGHAGEMAGLYVLYTTSEKFTNEIINAIRFQKTEEFRAKYRQIDILLVDDIQFIAGKESTEEEFFHTFNSLHNASKQIVVTSDRPPKAINSLQDRLRSRFEWGLLADVQAPEYEHRLAILRSKADSLRFTIPAGVIEYIARPQCSSVRELEGALNRVIAYATLHDAPMTTALATQALEHIYETKPASTLTAGEVLEGVCHYYNVDVELIRGKHRGRDIVWPRQVAMYLMREETSTSLLQIGTTLGGRDHTTIMHGWEKVQAEITKNELVRQEIAAVLETLYRRQA
jgi:chromosomal replication initiator protein